MSGQDETEFLLHCAKIIEIHPPTTPGGLLCFFLGFVCPDLLFSSYLIWIAHESEGVFLARKLPLRSQRSWASPVWELNNELQLHRTTKSREKVASISLFV